MIARAGLDQTKSNYSSLAWLLFTTFLIILASSNSQSDHTPHHNSPFTVVKMGKFVIRILPHLKILEEKIKIQIYLT